MSEQEIRIQDRLRQRIHTRHGTTYEARSGPLGEDWGYDAELDGRAADHINALESELAARDKRIAELEGALIEIEVGLKDVSPVAGLGLNRLHDIAKRTLEAAEAASQEGAEQ